VNPSVHIVAGPNGAGKTTFAREFLPKYAECKNFINADMIAQGVSPFSPEAASFHAGRLVLGEINRYAARREDFGFETTLSGRSYINLIRGLKRQRYQVNFFFLWVLTVDLP
jgi:predicted ABC-type ATPase